MKIVKRIFFAVLFGVIYFGISAVLYASGVGEMVGAMKAGESPPKSISMTIAHMMQAPALLVAPPLEAFFSESISLPLVPILAMLWSCVLGCFLIFLISYIGSYRR